MSQEKTITLANLTTYDTKIKELLNNKLDTVIFWDELDSAMGSNEIPGSEINDTTMSESSTWSSNKIDNFVTEVASTKADAVHIHGVVKSIELSGRTLSYTMDNGQTGSYETQDTTYETGTADVSGLTKLYTGTGANTDGAMTQNAITAALSGKSESTHGHAANDIIYLGGDCITDIANDTVTWWASKGSGWSFITQNGVITDQPQQYGMIVNYTTGTSEVFQFFCAQPNGIIYTRGGNGSGWSGTWKQHVIATDLNSYLPLSGGTMTGNIVQKNLTIHDGQQAVTIIKAYDDGDTANNHGSNVIIAGNGNMYIGGGESATAWYNTNGATMTEHLYLSADGTVYIASNCNTIANRKTITFNKAGAFILPSGTDYTTAKARNIKASTTDLTAGSSSLTNGDVYLVYE